MAALPTIYLPGALGPLASGEAVLDALARRAPVLTARYGPDDRIDALVDRVVALADGARFDLLGQSYGGWIAQCVARRHPEAVRRLVLAHSFTLDARDAWRLRLGGALLAALPSRLARRMVLARARRALAPLGDPDRIECEIDALDWRIAQGSFFEIIAAQQRCMRESLERPDFLSALAPAIRVLIIEGDDDPILSPRARAALRHRYPEAEVRRFAGVGHISALVRPEEFARAVADFLDAD